MNISIRGVNISGPTESVPVRKSVVDLVEAVRALNMRRAETGGVERVRIGLAAGEAEERFLALQKALEALDAEGGLAAESPAADTDASKLRTALDSVFRWIRLQGLPVDEPLEQVAEALGEGKRKKKAAGYQKLPVFAPNGFKKKMSWKPKMHIVGVLDMKGRMSMSDHRARSADFQQVVMKMGAAAPREAPEQDEAPAIKL